MMKFLGILIVLCILAVLSLVPGGGGKSSNPSSDEISQQRPHVRLEFVPIPGDSAHAMDFQATVITGTAARTIWAQDMADFRRQVESAMPQTAFSLEISRRPFPGDGVLLWVEAAARRHGCVSVAYSE